MDYFEAGRAIATIALGGAPEKIIDQVAGIKRDGDFVKKIVMPQKEILKALETFFKADVTLADVDGALVLHQSGVPDVEGVLDGEFSSE